MAWHTSTRADRLPPHWPALRRQVLSLARYQCEATTHDPQCTGKATEVDHITQGDDHSLPNLQALSAECHAAKTRAEAAERSRRYAAMRRRPEEPHPGRLKP